MLGKKFVHKSLTLLTAVAVWCVFSTIGVFAQSTNVMGEISVTGQVSVNGQTAVSNSTLVSGSTIVTGSNSSATVSLGKKWSRRTSFGYDRHFKIHRQQHCRYAFRR